MSALPLSTRIDRLRADARTYARGAIVAHNAGKPQACRELLAKEAEAIAEMRRLAPELDLTKEQK